MHHELRSLVAFAALLSAIPAQTTTFPSLVYATVPVAGVPSDLLLDLVVPNGQGPWPVVVWVHGGGWQGGSRLPIPGAATRLLTRGYAVASIDYRLSGAAIWPAQIHDCKAAVRYLRANAASFQLDPDRIGVMGSSAGGHLVAALATTGAVGAVRSGSFVVDLEGTVGPHLGTSSRVQCAVDQFGPTNMLLAGDLPTFDHDGANSPESLLIGGALQANPDRWATVDPASFVSPDDAPILAMHGTDDTTVPFHQSQLLLDAASAIGNDIAFFPVQGNGHGGPGFLAPDATAAMDAFLDRTLRNLPAVRVGVTASDASADESGDPALFVVSRSGSTSAELIVSLWLGGEVASDLDHAPVPLRCVIPAGQASVSVPFTPRDDVLVEGDERVELHLVPQPGYRVDHAASWAQATLFDDESGTGLPVVTIASLDASATEAAGNPGALRFVRTGATAASLVVAYEIAGTASNGTDYVALSGTVTIAAGSPGGLVVITPLQDTRREPGETVVLRVAAGTGHVRGAARTAHVVIADDDRVSLLPTVGVLGTEQVLGEPGDAGAFTLTRTGATTQALTVAFALTGTAQNGIDFAPVAASAVIPAGMPWVRIPLQVIDDGALEGRESVVLAIAPAAGYTVGAAAVQQLWIADDEAPTPAPSVVQLAVGPLAIGRIGTATIVGGEPNGLASLWLGFAPGYLPLPPFGIVQIDLATAGPFALSVLDSGGSVSLPLAIPAVPSLTGLASWWQALVSTAPNSGLVLTDVALRAVGGAGTF
jgi:acetyl esterase/lipase